MCARPNVQLLYVDNSSHSRMPLSSCPGRARWGRSTSHCSFSHCCQLLLLTYRRQHADAACLTSCPPFFIAAYGSTIKAVICTAGWARGGLEDGRCTLCLLPPESVRLLASLTQSASPAQLPKAMARTLLHPPQQLTRRSATATPLAGEAWTKCGPFGFQVACPTLW